VRTTPALLVIFILVLHRWLEMYLGWSEAVVFPAMGLIGAALIDRLLLPPDARLDARGWAVNVAIAGAAGVLLWVLAR
jgi:hypothetical protein